ncbi:MAG: rod shape-determining protein MreC [Clostridiales bacterium]|nr:rod shape-determining protein MreC [Clostridiales bacterium]
MRNLFNFLIRFRAWIVFIIYVIISCALLFHNNPYQRHVYLTSASAFSATVYEGANSVTGYFHLRSINEDLQRRNAQLESEVLALRHQVSDLSLDMLADSLRVSEPAHKFDFILAPVINNSVSHPNNFITIAAGEKDGIKPEMGVVDQNGVVGLVNVTGKNYARVLSLLNSDFRLSCKVKGNDVIGSLVWDGKSPTEALVEELPKHTIFQPGDTIITSGFSTVFPEGIPVGIVKGTERNTDDNFITLRIKLLTDFSTLSTVMIVVSHDRDEIDMVENKTKR